ncbi:sigma 54-interacting transcriptional regulator [Paraliomyxa miuraensis]|uniref:sigma 54-interacting transcriptional regulator n=1 Tax=Paraliomyxa miuraensis TaxID=376150 RepID=UPI00224EAB8F|nr:sigma 54-interacting transcriptional regulator [Paraliomyxa miuraensis]MCX4240338.1 sigma 54-interacting transcriptional regulator [Paraliomyxa miuraensis]
MPRHELPIDIISRNAGPAAVAAAVVDAVRVIQVARSSAPALITGETGTGKTRMAHMLHMLSRCAGRTLLCVNCAAMPPSVTESELFGTRRGAFTGATDRPGLIEACNGGTLLLDEIGDLPLPAQAKLLSTIEEQKVRRIGSNESTKVDVRILAATHVDLRRAVREGRFRADLLYRLDVGRVHLPALREQEDGIRSAVWRLLAELGVPHARLAAGEHERLSRHAWPGNFRELRNALQRAMIHGSLDALRPAEHIMELVAPDAGSPRASGSSGVEAASDQPAPWPTAADVQKHHALVTYERFERNVERAAQALGVAPVTLRRWLKKWKSECSAQEGQPYGEGSMYDGPIGSLDLRRIDCDRSR